MRKKCTFCKHSLVTFLIFNEKSEALFLASNKKMCKSSTFNKQIDFKFRILEYTVDLKHFSTKTLLLSNFKVPHGLSIIP